MNEASLIATIDELKLKIETLAEENASLRHQRDRALEQTFALLPTATPEQESEYLHLRQTGVPGGLATLIAELEAKHG